MKKNFLSLMKLNLSRLIHKAQAKNLFLNNLNKKLISYDSCEKDSHTIKIKKHYTLPILDMNFYGIWYTRIYHQQTIVSKIWEFTCLMFFLTKWKIWDLGFFIHTISTTFNSWIFAVVCRQEYVTSI